ncbi:hypothetical protein QC534_003101 [Escherichia coli]|nr:hypothetical protein [Escherichia coli]HDL6676050.1 hypothetical protein [Yersinia enterocolitica]
MERTRQAGFIIHSCKEKAQGEPGKVEKWKSGKVEKWKSGKVEKQQTHRNEDLKVRLKNVT